MIDAHAAAYDPIRAADTADADGRRAWRRGPRGDSVTPRAGDELRVISADWHSPSKTDLDRLGLDLPVADYGWSIDAAGLRQLVDEAPAVRAPIIVTENGMADAPESCGRASWSSSSTSSAVYRRIIEADTVDPALFADHRYGEPGFCDRLDL